jgi:hypothetical protein
MAVHAFYDLLQVVYLLQYHRITSCYTVHVMVDVPNLGLLTDVLIAI